MDVRATSKVLGLIGHPVAHSFSPEMHNAAIDALGIKFCYVAFPVLPSQVCEALQGLKGLNIRGLNVTIPHKSAVMEHLDWISEEALAVGSVNTINNEEGKLFGYNTDVYGLVTALERGVGLEVFPPHCVVLGSGGAARAVVYALGSRLEVEQLTILNRTSARAEALAFDMEKITGKPISIGTLDAQSQVRFFSEAGLVVNATSLGMYPNLDETPLMTELAVHADLVLFDTVYNPLDTRMMAQFRSIGALAYGGLDMLVYQGAKSFQIWTGMEPPVDLMKETIINRFQT